MVTKKKRDSEDRAFLAKSVRTGRFFEKEGFTELSDVVKYAIKKSTS